MEATSTVHLLLSIDHFIETAKASSLRIAFLFVHFLFILYTVYVVGRALQPMHEFGRMHARETSKFQKGGTIWPMLDFLHVRNILFHTKSFTITLRSGVVQICGKESQDLHFLCAELKYSRPQNKEELFNLRHSSARNAIECIFGVLKRWFRILLLAPEYSLEVQARLPASLAPVHNFISIHQPNDQPISSTTHDGAAVAAHVHMYEDDVYDVLSPEAPNDPDHDLHRDTIAQKMWDDYIIICEGGGIDVDDEIGSDLDEYNSESGDDGDE